MPIPGDFTWRFIRPVVQAAEDVRVDRNKEQRAPFMFMLAQHIAAFTLRIMCSTLRKRRINVRRVMHRQNDGGHDLPAPDRTSAEQCPRSTSRFRFFRVADSSKCHYSSPKQRGRRLEATLCPFSFFGCVMVVREFQPFQSPLTLNLIVVSSRILRRAPAGCAVLALCGIRPAVS